MAIGDGSAPVAFLVHFFVILLPFIYFIISLIQIRCSPFLFFQYSDLSFVASLVIGLCEHLLSALVVFMVPRHVHLPQLL